MFSCFAVVVYVTYLNGAYMIGKMASTSASTVATQEPVKASEVPDEDIFELAFFDVTKVDEELAKLQQELKEALKSKINARIYKALNDLGTAYYRLFEYNKAELCHLMHLKFAQSPVSLTLGGGKQPRSLVEENVALVNLGCVYHARRQYELALQTFRAALTIAEKLENMPSKARILNNMGHVYENVCDFESAIGCQLERWEVVTKLNDVNGQIKCSAALGSFYHLTGELRESIKWYSKVIISLQMKQVKRQLDAVRTSSPPVSEAAYFDDTMSQMAALPTG